MKEKNKISVAMIMLIALFVQSLPALACSFGSATYYTYSTHPDLPLKPYAAGKLGILQSNFARSYLLVAYRYLSDHPLSAQEQSGIVSLWNDRLSSNDYGGTTDTSAWLKARAAVPSATKITELNTDRPISNDDSWQRYCNCQPSAFEAAVKKLNEMIAKYGADSNQTKDWLTTQDEVFSNCGTALYSDTKLKAAIPAALPEAADTALSKDRSYQIAAANFYAQNFEKAREEFDRIASDANSPWKQISAYLAVRAIIRQASLAKTTDLKLLAVAADRIKKLIADSSNANLLADLKALKDFVSVRLTPAEHLQELSAEQISAESAGEFTKTIDVLIGDTDEGSDKVAYSALPASVKSPDLVDWIMTFQCTDDTSKQHAIERWKQTHSVAWLVAAASKIEGKNPNAAAILAEIAKCKSEAARWTLFYEANRINYENDKDDKVRAELDKVLAHPPADLTVGALNALKLQRLPLSTNLDELVRFGALLPLANCNNGGMEEIPDDIDAIIKTGKSSEKLDQLLRPELANAINNKLPLSVLVQLSSNKGLAQPLRNMIAWTSWVRAVLVGDDVSAKNLAVVMRPFNKEKDSLIGAFLSAATPEDRKFAAALLMLKFSSAQPQVSSGPLSEDGYGDSSGWWWASAPVGRSGDATDADFDPLFLTAVQKAEAAKQNAKLAKVEGAPNYLGKIVMAYASTHPADPRVPEALHWAVNATHYGATDDASKVLSKQEFQLLHLKYKSNPWTKKTPFYY